MKPIPSVVAAGAILASLLIQGCAGTPVHLGPRLGDAVPAGSKREIHAKACGFQLLLVIPINVNDRQERAYQQLEGAAGGDFITEVKIREEWTYAFVGTNYCTAMSATAIKRESQPIAQQAAPAPVPQPEPVEAIVPALPAPADALPAQSAAIPAASTGLHLRTRPIADADLVELLPPGTAVEVITKMTNAGGVWCYVSFNGRKGWVRESEIAAKPPSAS